MLSIVLIALILWGPGISWTWIFLPLVMAVQLCFMTGIVWLLAVGFSYFEDTQKITQAVTRILFYFSGIFFTAERVPAALQVAFWCNPLAILLQSYRDILVDHQMPNFSFLSYVSIWAIILMLAGFMLCKHIDKKLMKEVVV